MIAASQRPKRRIASGNHAIDGIVCSPVMSEATAVRSSFHRTIAKPIAIPMAIARR